MTGADNEDLSTLLQEKLINPVQSSIKVLQKMSNEQQTEINVLKADNKKLKICLGIIALITVVNITLIAVLK